MPHPGAQPPASPDSVQPGDIAELAAAGDFGDDRLLDPGANEACRIGVQEQHMRVDQIVVLTMGQEIPGQ